MKANPEPLSCLFIKLSVIQQNYCNLQKLVGPKTQVSCVVKSNAYGLGAKEISKALFEKGCREFYVDDCLEGENLRKSLGEEASIFLFKGLFPGEEEVIFKNNLIPVLNNQNQIDLLESFATKKSLKISCCLHVDTGMTRLGVPEDQADKAIEHIEKNALLKIKYVLSHLACADDNTNEMNQRQLQRFQKIAKKHSKYRFSFANSAGIFLSKEMHFDQVRPGICLYGGLVGLVSKNIVEPAISVTTKIINIYNTTESVPVGYGSRYQTKKNQKIATIPMGYFDGIFRCLSNKGWCCISGKKAGFVGSVSMGLTSIDLSSIPEENCKIGQEVEVIGSNISLETIAKVADTINYEILTSLRNVSHKKYI